MANRGLIATIGYVERLRAAPRLNQIGIHAHSQAAWMRLNKRQKVSKGWAGAVLATKLTERETIEANNNKREVHMRTCIIVATIVFTQGTTAFSQVGKNSQPPIEEEARRLAWADGAKNGVPRKISQEFNLVKVEAIGKRFVKTYEFAYPISPVSDQDRVALSQEARQNFKTNACQSSMRPLLNRGLIVVQKINYFNSGNIVSTEFGEADCR